MASIRIRIHGDPGTTKTAQMHRAVADHWRRRDGGESSGEKAKDTR
jgi:hypothetical protein